MSMIRLNFLQNKRSLVDLQLHLQMEGGKVIGKKT